MKIIVDRKSLESEGGGLIFFFLLFSFAIIECPLLAKIIQIINDGNSVENDDEGDDIIQGILMVRW